MKPKKNSKVDLNKRTVLFLQIGLIAVLLIAYLGIEWKTYEKTEQDRVTLNMEPIDEEIMPVTIVEQTPPPKIPTPPEIIEVVPDDPEIEEDPIASTEPTEEALIEPTDIKEAPKEEPIEKVPFKFIEDAPVFPGCEGVGNYEERKQCMSEKITRYINQNFNKDIGNQLGLSEVNRVHVLFEIDENGLIQNVQTRAPHPKLEQEAERVINSLPKMIPGKQRGRPVTVSYALPIVFQVQN